MAKGDKERIRKKLIGKQRKGVEKAMAARGARSAKPIEAPTPTPPPPPGPPDRVLEIELTLEGAEPAVRRTLQIPSNMTFAALHEVIQSAMGWEYEHLHEFRIKKVRLGPVFENDRRPSETEDDSAAILDDFDFEPGASFNYIYDFGDHWSHELKVKRVFEPEAGRAYPRLVDGAGACPPEDCGGMHRYKKIAAAFRDPEDPEYAEIREEMIDWLGENFDPDAFDLAATDTRLGYLRERHS